MIALAFLVAAQVIVTGTPQYEDRDYTTSGFTGGTTIRPIRAADVEIILVSDGSVVGTGLTDPVTGAFSIASIPSGVEVQARIYARHSGSWGDKMNAVVMNNSTSNAVAAGLSNPINTGATTAFGPVLFTILGGAAPAFNIFDCEIKSFQYQASVDVDLPSVPPLLKIYWQAGSSTGTFFARTLNSVFLAGTSADPDEYDDDIILHEIGHWVASNFSKDDTLGGPHTIVDQLDPRTSWSEGWAHYWSSTVRRFFPAEYASPQTQVDNLGGGGFSVFNVETPSFASFAIMATNELAVVAVLWDITDAANEAPFDTLTGNEQAVWQAVNNQIPLRTNITLEDFTAGLAIEAPAIMPAVTGSEGSPGIMKARSIRYYPDSSEVNDTSATATSLPLGPAGLAQRTLFGAGDQDWYQVSLVSGILVAETLNLGDGADPLIELFASDGSTLLASGKSPLQFSIITGGTYYLRVTSASAVVENGYYDVRAQIVLNVPPVVSSVSASVTSGFAPLRVTFSGVASDFENEYLEYQWDFEGDGRYDWASLRGPRVTTTYARPGVYNATLRVVDGAAAAATRSVLITVLPSSAPAIVVTQDSAGGPAPSTVTFGVSVSGVIPVSYAWDFDGDGVVDRISVTSDPVAFTYRSVGAFTPRVTVMDTFGRAYQVFGGPVTITAAAPPTLTLTATNGNIPYAALLSATPSAAGTLEYDVDGDGAYEVVFSPPVTPLSFEIHRAGVFTAKARVTDPSGVSASATAPLVATAIGTRGWMIAPRGGDALAGTVTLTAEATPAGRVKKAQFQYRQNSPPGAWIDIGGALLSTDTLFTSTWDVTPLPASSIVDLRVLIDDAISSGDSANTVMTNAAAPTWSESGGTLDAGLDPTRAKTLRNIAGVWVIAPAGGPASLRISPASRPLGNGSALALAPVGGAWRITAAAPFGLPLRVRLPLAADDPSIEIHAYDEAAGVWYRPGMSRVSHDDGWVEAEAFGPGIFALFGSPPGAVAGGSGSGGRFCSAHAGGNPGPWIVVLALGLVACCRRR